MAEAVDQIAAGCRVGLMLEHRADVLPVSERGQGHRRVGLAPLPDHAVVEIGRGIDMAGGLAFQHRERAGQVFGVVAEQSCDRAAASRVKAVFNEESGQRREQMLAHRQQGVRPARDQQAVLGRQPRGHITADDSPASVVRRIVGQRTGHTQALSGEPLAVFQNRPKRAAHLRGMGSQGFADDEYLLWRGSEQAVEQILDLSAIGRQQSQAGMQLSARIGPGFCVDVGLAQGPLQPVAIRRHLVDDCRDVFGGSLEQARLQSQCALPAEALASEQQQHRQACGEQQAAYGMVAAGSPHQDSLGVGPVAVASHQADGQPLPPRWQETIFGMPAPKSAALGQPQLGSTSPRFPQFPGEPVAQGRDQVIVSELVVSGRTDAGDSEVLDDELPGRPTRRGPSASSGMPSGSVGVINRNSPSRI